MRDFRDPNEARNSLLRARQVDAVCDRFEAALQAGGRPRIEDYLAGLPEPGWLLRELLALELDYRRARGERLESEEYCLRFPDQAPLIHLLFHATAPESPWPGGQSTVPELAAPDRPAAPGTVLGEYEVGEPLGRGGMGVVYKARQLKLNRPVALKMIRDGILAGPDQLARFRLEANAVARLQHANIVQIYEIGEQDGRPYLSLEFVNGGNLAQKLAGMPLPPPQAAQLVLTLARAVQYAHQQGVVHRDLKPANVMLTLDGVPKITDFGLAKDLETEVFLTHTPSGALLGTPSYMAPEQAWGKTQEVGPAVDVYALGAILYEALTGQPPFLAARLLETLDQVRSREPIRPCRLQPRLPHDLETICLKCLEKDPLRRYPSAGDLADDLRRFLGGEPVRARRTPAWERVLKWAKRRPAAAALAAMTCLACLLLVAMFQAFDRGRSNGVGEPPSPQDQATLYWARIGLVERDLAANNVEAAARHLEGCPEALRGWEWHHLKRAGSGRGLLTLRGHEDAVTCLAFGPGGRLVSASLDGTVKVWGPGASGVVLTFRGHVGSVHGASFSPDGGRITSVAGPDWDHRRRPQELLPPPPDAREGVWRSGETDGGETTPPGGARELLVMRVEGKEKPGKPEKGDPEKRPVPPVAPGPWGAPGVVKVWDSATGKEELALAVPGRLITCVAFSPDGKWLATGHGLHGSPEVPRKPAPTDRPKEEKKESESRNRRDQTLLALRVPRVPDDQAWVSALLAPRPPGEPAPAETGEIKLWDLTAGKEGRTLRGHARVVASVAFDPDGKRLASGSWDGTVKVWDVSAGKEVLTCRGHTGPVTSVAFSPDGRWLASGSTDETVRIWDARTGKELLALREHAERVNALAFSPDGKRLASAGSDRTVKVWDVTAGQQPLTLRGHSVAVLSVAFSPDGCGLATADAAGVVRLWDGTPIALPSAYRQAAPEEAPPPEPIVPPEKPSPKDKDKPRPDAERRGVAAPDRRPPGLTCWGRA